MTTTTRTIKGLSILLVEDEKMTQVVHRGLLERLGCQVEIAKNAKEALILSKKHHDIILMDIGLPDGNGIEVTAKIRQRESAEAHTPIIAVTAYPLHEVKQDCLTVGMDSVLSKPINAGILKKALKHVLHKSME